MDTQSQVTGKLKYNVVEGQTTATHVYATYPLKFLHPRRTIHQGFDTYITVVVLGTQATTKVFKAEDEGAHVSQSFSLTVGSRATLAFLPDPVTCFERAKYRQSQVFHLEEYASLVFVDWLTSGRKRNYPATGSIRETRTETLEHWDFSEYDTMSEIFVGGERLVTDRVRLADEEDVSLRQRMHGMHVLGLMVVVGSKMQVITDQLLELSSRKKLHNARDITPQGRLAAANTFPGVIASASSLGPNAVIVRFCGQDAESAMSYVKEMLSPLRQIIGFTPYQENR
ncbi:hypothetical protein BBO99_00003035 [Phytophthora kernoviae]|uniref:Urease accessory protein UreD n=2 Tax=Phytophthora kernoviae TaxID=325452 RepID=A0A3R7JWA3_9STRA|nr:hypothetical protein G195_003755 [Phytophthora kernoviae 00238/432]KAG2528942.1 hypothetical protein JM16_000978 [Phytophthora kernoviae]KAG2530233.1 hypothetical protein JM18_001059 [Phytophthora kernoviae]RLN06417.1 hypothetical protein BBI17_003187 [Phytophthora kernoviae]RLN82253.1 hypothetical protein BBO99_00003035 [Phytophthora kernoviae]